MPNLLTDNFQHIFIHHPPWQNKKFVKLEMERGFGFQRQQISEQKCLLHSCILFSCLPGFAGYNEEPWVRTPQQASAERKKIQPHMDWYQGQLPPVVLDPSWKEFFHLLLKRCSTWGRSVCSLGWFHIQTSGLWFRTDPEIDNIWARWDLEMVSGTGRRNVEAGIAD